MSFRFLPGLAAALFLSLSVPAFAVQPDEVLKDPAMEARAREISKELRCLVCQNQSIDDSNAPLARDLRVLVRERLVAATAFSAVARSLHDARPRGLAYAESRQLARFGPKACTCGPSRSG